MITKEETTAAGFLAYKRHQLLIRHEGAVVHTGNSISVPLSSIARLGDVGSDRLVHDWSIELKSTPKPLKPMTTSVKNPVPQMQWDEGRSGFTLDGTHYQVEKWGDHDVQVTVRFKVWEQHYKSTSRVCGGTLGNTAIYEAEKANHEWTVLMDVFNWDSVCDLFPELEDNPISDESYLTEEQLMAYHQEVFNRGLCELRHKGITTEVYSDDGDEIEDDAIARALGLDPAHTSVCYQG